MNHRGCLQLKVTGRRRVRRYSALANVHTISCYKLRIPPFSRRPTFSSIPLPSEQRWDDDLRNSVTVGGTKGGTAEVEFVCGDFTVLDWSDGESVPVER